jgi:hypothetical protein
MKTTRIIGMAAVGALMAALLGGCAGSYQARSVDLKEATLVNPDILVKGTGDEALYRYQNPKADFKQYTKIILDPVLIKKDGELDKDELENYQKLSNNAFVFMTKELEKSYQMVQTPEPGAMRITMAITDADSSKPVRNTLSTIVPMGIGLNILKYAVTGKQMGVGEISGEMKITDSMTGELLFAALDRRVGGKDIAKLWSSWYNADEGLKFWAGRLGYVLCQQRGGTDCVKPEN